MQFDRFCARGDPELVAEVGSELLVDAQRFGGVAGSGERVHQVAVAALTIRGADDQLASGAFGSSEFGASDAEGGVGVAFERA